MRVQGLIPCKSSYFAEAFESPVCFPGFDMEVQMVSFYRIICFSTLSPFKIKIHFSSRCQSVYAYLNSHLDLIKKAQPVGFLTVDLHVWPDFHGNRSPLADLTLKGMVSKSQSMHENEGQPRGCKVWKTQSEETGEEVTAKERWPRRAGLSQLPCYGQVAATLQEDLLAIVVSKPTQSAFKIVFPVLNYCYIFLPWCG